MNEKNFAQLVLISEGNIIMEHYLPAKFATLKENPRLYIGRNQDNDICLHSQEETDLNFVSRYHCIISYDSEKNVYNISDYKSLNGTVLNGQPLRSNALVKLNDGDSLTLGTSNRGGAVLRFRQIKREDLLEGEYNLDETLERSIGIAYSEFMVINAVEDEPARAGIIQALKKVNYRRVMTFVHSEDTDEEPLSEKTRTLIANADGVIVLLSPDALKSIRVQKEAFHAKEQGRRVFPVLIKGDANHTRFNFLDVQRVINLQRNYDMGIEELSSAVYFHLFPTLPRTTLLTQDTSPVETDE